MIAIPDRLYMTPHQYLDWEEQQELKYEYIAGEVIAMTGGTIPHNDAAFNLAAALKNHLRGKGCKVQIADGKVGISEQGPFHYPDVMVSCDQRDRKAKKAIYYPCLIVEVLSPGTERFDRGRKFQNYRQIATLQEYVLISLGQKIIECFRLNERGVWELHTYTDELELTSVNFRCAVDAVYEDVLLGEDE